MKTVMSVDQYRLYKSGKVSLINIRLQNIGINTDEIITYIIANKRLIFTLAILTTGVIVSEITLSGLAVNSLEYKPEICVNLFSQNNSGVYGI